MDEANAFYVVRKGDIIGVYRNFSDCQDQAGPSVSSPPMSVYKGYYLPKEAEEHLDSHGLKNAAFTIKASDMNDDLFGDLIPCPIQEPPVYKGKTSEKISPPKRMLEIPRTPIFEYVEPKRLKSENSNAQPIISNCDSCTLMFDGASKGNPGPSGAGAILRARDGSVVWQLREGVGHATNNVAEYRAVILGLRSALNKGFKHISVQGDSKLVCMQIQGLWKINNQNMADLCKVAKELMHKFVSFKIDHVLRGLNSEADAQANQAIYLKDGEVTEDFDRKIV